MHYFGYLFPLPLEINLINVKFSLATGEPLIFTPGLPADHGGPLLNGATASHVKAGFGQIVLQEFSTEKASFRNCMISWKKPEKILCQYQHPPGVFARVALDNRIHEFIKGAGELHVNKEQFVTLTGSEWTGLLLAEKPGELDEWVCANEENMKLFEDLTNDFKSKWAKQWFAEAGVNTRFIKWKNMDGWYKPETKSLVDFYILMAVVFAVMAGVYLILKIT